MDIRQLVPPLGDCMNECIETGLKNAPRKFQHFMEQCLDGLRDDICIPYIDDIIVFSQAFQDRVDHNRKVLRRLREHGVKLNTEEVQTL